MSICAPCRCRWPISPRRASGSPARSAARRRSPGPAKAPAGNYNLAIAKVSTPDLAKNGVGPLDIKAEGQLSGGRVDTRASISGPFISGVSITGSAPISAGELDLAIKGALDLAVANPLLATSGSRVGGSATIDATVKGTPAAPRAGGTVRLSGARFDDSVNGISLSNIEGLVTGTERSVTLDLARPPRPRTAAGSARAAMSRSTRRQAFPARSMST